MKPSVKKCIMSERLKLCCLSMCRRRKGKNPINRSSSRRFGICAFHEISRACFWIPKMLAILSMLSLTCVFRNSILYEIAHRYMSFIMLKQFICCKVTIAELASFCFSELSSVRFKLKSHSWLVRMWQPSISDRPLDCCSQPALNFWKLFVSEVGPGAETGL